MNEKYIVKYILSKQEAIDELEAYMLEHDDLPHVVEKALKVALGSYKDDKHHAETMLKKEILS